MKALLTISVTFILFYSVSHAQNVIISSGIPSKEFDEVLEYVSQMKSLERSLVGGTLKGAVMFSKEFTLIDSVSKKFSTQFNAAVPKSFFTQEGKPRLLTEEFGKKKSERVQWTYATIEKSDSVVKHAQLIVYFESHKKKHEPPRIRNIEIKTKDVTTFMTNEEINLLYQRVKSIKVELPPPPAIQD